MGRLWLPENEDQFKTSKAQIGGIDDEAMVRRPRVRDAFFHVVRLVSDGERSEFF